MSAHVTKYIFVTGGVVSSLGKGIAAASIGRLLKEQKVIDRRARRAVTEPAPASVTPSIDPAGGLSPASPAVGAPVPGAKL